jgi:hypothetical protein
VVQGRWPVGGPTCATEMGGSDPASRSAEETKCHHGDKKPVVKRHGDKKPDQTSYKRDSSRRLFRASSSAQPRRYPADSMTPRSLIDVPPPPGVYINLVDSDDDSGGHSGVDSGHHGGGHSGHHGGGDSRHHGGDDSSDHGGDDSSDNSGNPEASVPLFLWRI